MNPIVFIVYIKFDHYILLQFEVNKEGYFTLYRVYIYNSQFLRWYDRGIQPTFNYIHSLFIAVLNIMVRIVLLHMLLPQCRQTRPKCKQTRIRLNAVMRTDHFLHDVANPSSRDLKLHFSYLSENLLVSVTQAGNFISITTFELYVPII